MIILLVVPPEFDREARVSQFLSLLEEKRGFDRLLIRDIFDWDQCTTGKKYMWLAKRPCVVAEIRLQEGTAAQHVADNLGRLAQNEPVFLVGIKAPGILIEPVFNTLRESQTIALAAAKSVYVNHLRFLKRLLGILPIVSPTEDELATYSALASQVATAAATAVMTQD